MASPDCSHGDFGPRIPRIFESLRRGGHKALMPFVTGGFPSLDVTRAVIPALERAGASIVEIGFPFSDPIADGPVIASSMQHALRQGTTPLDIFNAVRSIREVTAVGLVAMVSESIIARMGHDRFIAAAASAGFDGLIVPDCDLCAAEELSQLAAKSGMSFTLLIAPNTPPERISRITRLCSGFVYVLARIGITGEATSFDAGDLSGRIHRVRQHTPLPIAVGFGISSAEQVLLATMHADAAIIGSALVQRMGASGDPVAASTEFLASLQSTEARVNAMRA